MDYFNNNLNRTLIKAIIMPLIYGKTSMGFAEDLKRFFEKSLLFPSNQILIRIANKMLSIFKQHPAFKELMLFMRARRAFAALLFQCNIVIIRGPYRRSLIEYNKEEMEQIRIYFKKNNKYNTQKISLVKKSLDPSGNIIKSKTKTVNSFIANYIHFLDATICSSIIK